MSSSGTPKDNFFENVVNPYMNEMKMHPKELLLVDGELQIEDVRGPKGEGSLEDRMEKLEQEVFAYKKMAEREVDIFHRIVSELIDEHKKETTKLWDDILSLHNTTNQLQAQLYDVQNQNFINDYEEIVMIEHRRSQPKGEAEEGRHGPPHRRRDHRPGTPPCGEGAQDPPQPSPFRVLHLPRTLRCGEASRIVTAASAGRKTPERKELSGRQESAGTLPKGEIIAIVTVIEQDFIGIIIIIISTAPSSPPLHLVSAVTSRVES
ncbi:hypothetical protein QYE76_069902 [Lolium multiflorum]|uniref:Uncharacterized protein n=1 Tax=Lolium multiflorum TaxID=4521 RepID=A0AAD8WFD3_LOLMU|nr:hypothetical protein QYE76_069902 [Lolium multiflorum]